MQYWNFLFIGSELVQVNPDNSLAECVNIFIIQIEYAAKRNSFKFESAKAMV